MSSIINTNKKTIVLFQGGLGDVGDGFVETVERLKNWSTKMIKADFSINMKNFDVEKSEFYGLDSAGYLTKQNALAMEFNQKVASLVSLANSNLNKSILVVTSLSESIDSVSNGKINYLGFDSVNDQATKLVYLINAIKNMDSSIRIILVGHSQGGLVDLETAIRVPYKIEKIVSISTPYSAVSMAKKLININFIASIFKKDVYTMIQGDPKLAKKYKDRVEDLGTSSLYNNLKKRWKELSQRPSLIVFAGVSGLLTEYYSGYTDSATGAYTPDSYYKYPFDGLVSISEQVSIDYANIIGLSDPKLGCYSSKEFLKSPCYLQQGVYMSCKRACCLPAFDLNIALLKVGIEALGKFVDAWVKGTTYDFNINDFDIIKDIFNGVSGEPISNTNNQRYYDTYRSDYSHQNLRYCNETIARLIAIFNV